MNTQEHIDNIYYKLNELSNRLSQVRQAGGSHNLLSAVHPDTTPDTVVAGDIIYGHTGPVWKRLAKGNNNQVLTLDSGLPAWKDAPEAGAGGVFEDNFDDLEIYWAWTVRQVTGDRDISETSNGTLNIYSGSGNNCYWATGCPRIETGCPEFPCVIETKITDDWTVNDLTAAGLYVDQGGGSTNDSYHIERHRDDSNTRNGIYVWRWNTIIGSVTPMTTLPVWLRIRWAGGHRNYDTRYFDYSVNGTSWTNICSDANSGFYPGTYGLTMGLYGRNWTVAYPDFDVDFDYFKMSIDEGPG